MQLGLLLLAILVPYKAVHSARILSIAFMTCRSHKITYEPLLYELASRGHEVTVVGPFPSGKNIPNLREIFTIDMEKLTATVPSPNRFEMKEQGSGNFDLHVWKERILGICRQNYALPHVQALLNEKFDLVFIPALFNECAFGLAHKLNTTSIIISTVAAPSWIADVFGSPSPPSFVPNLFSGLSDEMSFVERVKNFLGEAFLRAAVHLYFRPDIDSLVRKMLNDPNIPTYTEIMKNSSLILSTSHVALSRARPFLPDIIEVGGMHCRPAKSLPSDLDGLDEFLNSSGDDDGFIYFSMGSNLNASTMPEKYRQIFVRTFAALKQKADTFYTPSAAYFTQSGLLGWKWETDQMEDMPTNVKLGKWLPQQDILGHPNIKAFLTHGGFGSTTEAAYHGVPLVGIPMLGDQTLNMNAAVASGFALKLEFTDLNEDSLLEALQKVITKPRFRERAQHLSKIFRDQPDKALDRAVFWTEYVLRHKEAVHLRSAAARDLNFVQYHSIDVVLALLAGVVTLICAGVLFCTRLGRRLRLRP